MTDFSLSDSRIYCGNRVVSGVGPPTRRGRTVRGYRFHLKSGARYLLHSREFLLKRQLCRSRTYSKKRENIKSHGCNSHTTHRYAVIYDLIMCDDFISYLGYLCSQLQAMPTLNLITQNLIDKSVLLDHRQSLKLLRSDIHSVHAATTSAHILNLVE
jgi:hypothetical protein